MSRNRVTGDNVNEALIALVGALEARDVYTGNHAKRVAEFVDKLTKKFRLEHALSQNIYNAALIHDIGMVSVPDAILLKQGQLTPSQRRVIETAPYVAEKILKPIKSLNAERLMILHLGERWDGHGYPDGLKQEHIPPGARFLAVAHAIDAMSQNRAYRRAYPISFCIEQLRDHAGTQFDPKMARAAADILCKSIPENMSQPLHAWVSGET